jgi:hypothetical protein
MLQTQTPTAIFTETQQTTLDPQGTSTAPTFQELLKEYNASLNPPEITWDRLIVAVETTDIDQTTSPLLSRVGFLKRESKQGDRSIC